MGVKYRIYRLFPLIPYLTSQSKIKNRFSFTWSMITGKYCNIEFKSGIKFSIETSDASSIFQLISLERYARSFYVENDNVVISFDNINKFRISTNELSQEDRILMDLLYLGLKEGAVFLDKNNTTSIKNEKTVKIIQDGRAIVETSEGVKFFLDSINGGSISECFVRRIHDLYSNDLMGKVVIDIGASNGDTPLYFASKGASVYAFEMTESNFNYMRENLKLNPELAKKITPVHAAIGKDEKIEYYQDSLNRVSSKGGSSFLINKYGENSVTHKVEGMSLGTILDKFKISQVDLLKMDCKGCEFFLKKSELEKVKRIKIEYYSLIASHKIDSILSILKELNFETIIFKHTTEDTTSLERHGNILGQRQL